MTTKLLLHLLAAWPFYSAGLFCMSYQGVKYRIVAGLLCAIGGAIQFHR